MTSPAFAKLNLILRVGGVRADGFHPLASWMVTTALHDTLTLNRRPGPFKVSTSDLALPTDHRNLATRAAVQFAEVAGVSIDGLHLHLEKRIPAGGGMGGGSSNAATTLTMLNDAFGHPLVAEQLDAIAAELGSDVTFFLHGPSAWCTGRGEIITPLAPPSPPAAVLFFPQMAVSTAEAYRRFDALPSPPLDESPPSLGELPAVELLEQLRNDLEPPVFAGYPALGELRRSLEDRLGRPVRMSGSGSTLFTLFDSIDEAAETAGRVTNVLAAGVKLCPM